MNDASTGTSGAKVVIAMLGGTLAIALIVVTAFLLTREEQLSCAEGQLQDNPVNPDGSFVPRTEFFATLGEAEAFVCKRIPYPRDSGDFGLHQIAVTRTTNLGSLIEGEGEFIAQLTYLGPDEDGGFFYEAFWPSGSQPPGSDAGETIRVNDHDGFLRPGDGEVRLGWSQDGFFLLVHTSLALDPLLAILETVR